MGRGGALVAVLLVAAGCGGGSDSATPSNPVVPTTTTAPTATAASSPTDTEAPNVAASATTVAPATSTTATEVPAEPEQAPSSTIATEVPAEPEQAPSSSPGCSDVLRRPPSFEEGIADHELWIGRLANGAIADQRLLGVGYSVADGLLIDQEVHVWAMAASDHVLHHGIVNQAGFTDYGPISVDGEVFQGFIDPDVLRLPDGRLGLVVVNGTNRTPGPICLLASHDGQAFETVGLLLDEPGVQDPAVVLIDDWVLAIKVHGHETIRILVGTPDTGFRRVFEVPGGDPDLAKLPDGTLRLTVCGPGSLATYASVDGRIWMPAEPIRSQTCGPSTITGTDLLLHLPKPGQGGALSTTDPDEMAAAPSGTGTPVPGAGEMAAPQPPEPGGPLDPPVPGGTNWAGPTICTSHGVLFQPPAFGVVLGEPLADPTAAVLDDGRIRLYAYAQDIGIVSAVSGDGRSFTEEPGVRIPGTEAGQPRVWRLPDGRWRMYVSKVREIVSFTSDDGLVFVRDPGNRLTARAAGLEAISSPSIVEFEPGRWRMYYSTLAVPGTGPGGKRAGSATSTDLLEWTVDSGWRLGQGAPHLTDSAEHPFPVVGAGGSVSLFYGKFRASPGGAPDGLWRATSTDGLTFTEEAYTGLYFGNDPEVLLLPNGERIIYYGNFDPAVGGQVLSADCVEW